MAERRLPRVVSRVRQSSLGVEFEKIGASRYDLADPYHAALTLPWPSFVIGSVFLYVLITTIFAVLYLIDPNSVTNTRPNSFFDHFFFSIETLATVGYGVMAPGDVYGHIISSTELVVGLGFTALITGVIFVRFSKAKAKIAYADVAVIAQYNGKPTLMLRIGNARMTVLHQLKAELHVLVREVTAEGNRFRRIHDLPLIRSNIPMFPLLLTLMHEIGPDSPLHGIMTQDIMDASDLTFMLSIEARDPDLFATVHDLKTYGSSDVRVGARFVDAVYQAPDGHSVADLTRLGDVEPDPAFWAAPGGHDLRQDRIARGA